MKKTSVTRKRNGIIYFLLGLIVIAVLLFFKTTNKYIVGVFGIAIYGVLPALMLFSILLLLGKRVKVSNGRLVIYIFLLFSVIITLHILFSKSIYSKDFLSVMAKTIEKETVGGVLASTFTYLFYLAFNYQITLLIFFLSTAILGLFVIYPLLLSNGGSAETKKAKEKDRYIEEDKSIYIESINARTISNKAKEEGESSYRDSVDILFGSGRAKHNKVIEPKKDEKYFDKLGYKNYKAETTVDAKNKIFGGDIKKDYYEQKYGKMSYSNPLTNQEYQDTKDSNNGYSTKDETERAEFETVNRNISDSNTFRNENNDYYGRAKEERSAFGVSPTKAEKSNYFSEKPYIGQANISSGDKNANSLLFGAPTKYDDYYEEEKEEERAPFVIDEEVINHYDKSFTNVEEKPSYSYVSKKEVEPQKDKREEYIKNEKSFKDTYYAEEKPQPIKKIAKKPNAKFVFPPLDLLDYSDSNTKSDMVENYHYYKEKIENTYSEFNIKVEVTHAMRGPAFTRYELKLAPGIQLSRVLGVKNNLEMRLSAGSIRILAPIPKKDAIGIEIPNKEREMVSLKTMLLSSQYQSAKNGIMIALGKTLEGDAYSVDLATLPHLLIAGATGTGKSVCINCLILSILYKYTPDEVRLILIDPKKVELSPFRRLPHLLISETVTEPQQAINTLKWLTEEMDIRYKTFQGKCNNIDEYNKICDANGVRRMHKIVLIVDEMADLMVKSKATVETYLVRLAQLARAAGIHLILATQRPTVNVITGLIKSNILARIAFTVKNATDSRIVLDESGAENLLKKGDMLYSCNNDTLRIQGAFVSNEERTRVADFIRENNESDFDQAVEDVIMGNNEDDDDNIVSGNSVSKGDGGCDLDTTALKVLRTFIMEKKASVSMAQAKNGVGYIRASKIVNEFEKRGFVGEMDGSKPRSVLITMEEFMEKYGDKLDD